MKRVTELQRNQIVVEDDNKYEFYSYWTLIAVYVRWENLYLTVNRDYSRTTMKYLNKFILNYLHVKTNAKEIRKDLERWLIKLI